MADILHRLQINGTVADVYKALTTETGLKSWWSSEVRFPNDGSIGEIYIDPGPTRLAMRIQRHLTDQRVFWICEGDLREWHNTQLWWELRPLADNLTQVEFKHLNWDHDQGTFAQFNTLWAQWLMSLKEFIESGKNKPFYKDMALLFESVCD